MRAARHRTVLRRLPAPFLIGAPIASTQHRRGTNQTADRARDRPPVPTLVPSDARLASSSVPICDRRRTLASTVSEPSEPDEFASRRESSPSMDHTISLATADRRRSLAFYRDGLGLEAFGPLADDGVPEP